MLIIAGSALAVGESSANAQGSLIVTLSATGTGSSAVFNAQGNPVLTVGDSGSATITVDNPPATAPATAPTFTSSSLADGSPHWLIQFAGGDALFGVPPGDGASDWEVLTPSTGPCDVPSAALISSYATQLSFVQTVASGACGGAVTGVAIVASAPNSTATITNVLYDGMTISPGSDVVTVTSPGTQTSTVNVAISSLPIQASSDLGAQITAYAASGLPTGLNIDPTTGIISGTPTVAGAYNVTVTATDAAGTPGSVSFSWNVNSAAPTGTIKYSGTVRLFKIGLCLDDANNSSTSGAAVQVWRCNGLPNQTWQVMSNGTIQHNGLCLDARNLGTTNGTRLQLWSCTGGSNQSWDTSGFRIHYDNPNASGLVVDDTAFGHNGTRQELYANNGGANQQWETF